VQIQDDFLDCFGDPEVIGKIGTDIQDNKCSWLVVQALGRASAEQRAAIEQNYGKDDEAAVAAVKEVYRQLDLEGLFRCAGQGRGGWARGRMGEGKERGAGGAVAVACLCWRGGHSGQLLHANCCCCFCWGSDRRQYEQDSHDKLVKTIEGQDLLPQVAWAARAGKSVQSVQRAGGLFPPCPASSHRHAIYISIPAGRVQDAAQEDLQAPEVTPAPTLGCCHPFGTAAAATLREPVFLLVVL
jgi:hypothetical protein